MKNEKHLAKRVFAGIIDYATVLSINSVFMFLFGEKSEDDVYSVTGIKFLVIPLIWFLLIICTEFFLGATLGNAIFNLKPVDSSTEENITFKQCLIRRILDPIDLFFFGLIGFLCIINTEKGQRLGDLVAKTKVIRN